MCRTSDLRGPHGAVARLPPPIDHRSEIRRSLASLTFESRDPAVVVVMMLGCLAGDGSERGDTGLWCPGISDHPRSNRSGMRPVALSACPRRDGNVAEHSQDEPAERDVEHFQPTLFSFAGEGV